MDEPPKTASTRNAPAKQPQACLPLSTGGSSETLRAPSLSITLLAVVLTSVTEGSASERGKSRAYRGSVNAEDS